MLDTSSRFAAVFMLFKDACNNELNRMNSSRILASLVQRRLFRNHKLMMARVGRFWYPVYTAKPHGHVPAFKYHYVINATGVHHTMETMKTKKVYALQCYLFIS